MAVMNETLNDDMRAEEKSCCIRRRASQVEYHVKNAS